MSSFRTLVAAAVLIGAVAAAFVRIGRHPGGAPSPSASPYVLLVRTNGHMSTRSETGQATGAGSLVRATLGAAAAKAIADHFDVLQQHADIAANPLVIDLDEGNGDEEAKKLGRDLLPRLTAARALRAGEWQAPDGLDVRVATECTNDPNERCVSLHDEGRDGDAGDSVSSRARFLAWPIARALRVRAPHGNAATLAAAMRAAPADRVSAIALIVDDAALHADPDAHDELRARAASLLAMGRDRGAALHDLSETLPPGTPLVPWLTLGDDILVVPKLSADRAVFAEQARALVGGLPAVD